MYEVLLSMYFSVLWNGDYASQLVELLVWLEMLYWIDHVWSSIECVLCLWSQCATRCSFHMFCLGFVCRKLILSTSMTLASGGGGGESDLPVCGPPASFSAHLASSAVTPAESVHKSRGYRRKLFPHLRAGSQVFSLLMLFLCVMCLLCGRIRACSCYASYPLVCCACLPSV